MQIPWFGCMGQFGEPQSASLQLPCKLEVCASCPSARRLHCGEQCKPQGSDRKVFLPPSGKQLGYLELHLLVRFGGKEGKVPGRLVLE